MRKTTFALLCLQGALLSFNVAATAALIPSVAREFGAAHFVTGRIVWLYMLAYGSAALVYGPLVRVVSVRRIQLVCFALFVLGNCLAGFAPRLDMLCVARFAMGLFGASVIPIGLIMIGAHARERERGKRVGTFFGITFIASLGGLFLSGVVYWRLIYLIPALLGAVLWIHMYWYLPAYRHRADGRIVNYAQALRNKRVLTLFGYIFCVSFLYHSVQQWLAVFYAAELNLKQYTISMLITLTSASGIFGELAGGVSADKLGRRRTINAGLTFMIIALLLLAARLPVALNCAVMVIWGLGWTFNHSGLSTLLTDLPKSFLNEAASLNSSVRFLAGGAGAAAGGFLMKRSFNTGLGVAGVCLFTLLLFSNTLARKRRKSYVS